MDRLTLLAQYLLNHNFHMLFIQTGESKRERASGRESRGGYIAIETYTERESEC